MRIAKPIISLCSPCNSIAFDRVSNWLSNSIYAPHKKHDSNVYAHFMFTALNEMILDLYGNHDITTKRECLMQWKSILRYQLNCIRILIRICPFCSICVVRFVFQVTPFRISPLLPAFLFVITMNSDEFSMQITMKIAVTWIFRCIAFTLAFWFGFCKKRSPLHKPPPFLRCSHSFSKTFSESLFLK